MPVEQDNKRGISIHLKGFTLMELAIVMLATGLVLGVIWVAASAVWSNYKVYRVNQQISSLIRNVRDAYGVSNKPLTNPIMAALNAGGVIPGEMVIGNGASYAHALGGALDIAVHAGVMPNPSALRIRLLGTSREGCMKTVMEFPALAPELGIAFIGTSVGGRNLTPATLVNATPVTSAEAAAWCSSATNNEVRIAFSIRS